MHAEKRAVYGDCRDDLPELSEKHKERIGGAVVTTSRLTSISSIASVAIDQTCKMMKVSPHPLAKQSTRNRYAKMFGLTERKANIPRFATAAIIIPIPQSSFLPNFLTSFGVKNMNMTMGAYVQAVETRFIQGFPK